MTLLDRDLVRIALATQAYDAGTVRLVDRSLSGFTHLVATRHGLFATDGTRLRLIAHGLFYGLTLCDEAILAFEACDRPQLPSARGRIVRFTRTGDEITAAEVVVTGLDNGCHQIDVIENRLCVVDTYNQRIRRYPLDGGEPDTLSPIGDAEGNEWAGGYAHLNSILAHGDDLLLMLHNGADKTGRVSEIARLDRDWQLRERIPLQGLGCHNLAILENGTILACGSFAGELIGTDGLRVPVCDMMTRGLSVGDDVIVVGGSAFADRHVRDAANGALFFLDRHYRSLGHVMVPAPVMEVRRLDGRDRSLSGHLKRLAAPSAA